MKSREKLKILHFVYDHPENPWCGGGGAGRTWAINNYLSKKHDITILCGGFPGARPQDTPGKVRFLGKANSYVASRIKFILNSRKIKADSYDLVVEEFSYYAPIFSRFPGAPMVSILHGQHGLSAIRSRGIYGFVSLISEYLLLPQRKSIIIVSEHLRPAVPKDAKVTVIGLGTNIPDSLQPSTEEYVLFLGRLDIWHKGLDTLIRAWAKIPQQFRTLPLHIVGGGNEKKVRALIKQTSAKDVYLTGRVDHDKVMDVINRAAFVCMPSRMEGFGLVAAEALSVGKPVIVSEIPSLRKIIPKNIAGLHVPVNDFEALSLAIQNLLSDLKFRKSLAKGALQNGRKFRWDKIAEEQERFYLETIQRSKI